MKIRTLAVAAILLAGASAPALAADWDKIDSVSVTYGQDKDSVSPDFGGSVERLRFTARDSGVECKSITAVFGNGTKTQIFSGKLAEGASKTLDLPGAQRQIARLNFNCHANQRSGGRIVVEADIGQYRSVWMKSPNWARIWANLFGNWDQATNRWVLLGHQTFTGRSDKESTASGWRARSVQAVGLRPLNDDARCTRAVATFGNGSKAELNISQWTTLREDRTYKIDLPGNQRTLTRLVLKCRAEHGRSVTMNIYADK